MSEEAKENQEENSGVKLPPDFEAARAVAIKVLTEPSTDELKRLYETLRVAYNLTYTMAYESVDKTLATLDVADVDRSLVCEIILQSIKKAAAIQALQCSRDAWLEQLLSNMAMLRNG